MLLKFAKGYSTKSQNSFFFIRITIILVIVGYYDESENMLNILFSLVESGIRNLFKATSPLKQFWTYLRSCFITETNDEARALSDFV